MASSLTVTMSSTHVAISGPVISPGCFTAMPSASVRTGPSATESPQYGAHTLAWTPTIRTWGSTDLTAIAMPDASPPPPSGTMICDSCSTSSSSSRPSVPCPAMTAGSSNGAQKVVPLASARSRDRATASDSAAPCSITVAP